MTDSAATETKFTLVHQETATDECGQTGGPDYNLGREFSKQFTWETTNPEEPFVTITTTTYIQGRNADGEDVSFDDLDDLVEQLDQWNERYAEARREHYGPDMHRWLDENPQPVRFCWSEQTEFIIHSDLNEVGSTEIRSDYEYGEGSYQFFNSIAKAEEAAKAAIDRISDTHFSPKNV